MYPQSYQQSDARVRELVATIRRMFPRSPLSDSEQEILARECLRTPVSVIAKIVLEQAKEAR